MTAPELIRRLETARRRTRRLVALQALAELAAAGAVVVPALIALDWLIHMPAFLRGTATAGAVWIAAVWVWRRVVEPIRRPVSLQEVAMRVDRSHPELRHRLATTVEHIASPNVPDNLLWRRVVEQSLAAAEQVNWETLIDTRRPRRRMGGAALAAIGLMGLGWLWPSGASIGLRRFGWPLGSAQWPRQVQIEALTGDQVVAAGESAEVRMRLVRGRGDALRAWVVWREGTQAPRRELMSAGDDGVFRQSNAAVRVATTYWFEAGDDSTAEQAGHIRVVQRPAVTSATLAARPPSYAAVLGTTTHSLLEGRASVLAGTRVEIEIGVSKAIARDREGRGQIVLRDENGTSHRLECREETRRLWRVGFEVERGMTLGLMLTDAEGQGLRTAPQYRIEVRPDAPPSVAITRPTHLLEVTPVADVVVGIVAQDDIDVTSIMLRSRIVDAVDLPPVAVWSGSARQDGATTGASVGRDVTEAGMPARVEASPRWSLAKYGLPAGAIVEYWAEATDGYEWKGERHAAATSAVMRLRVLSQQEFADRMRDESQALVQRIRQLATDEESLRADTVSARTNAASTQPDFATGLLSRQRAIQAAAADVVAQYKALAERIRQNRLDDQGAAREADSTAADLRSVAAGAMSQAVSALARAARGVEDAKEGGSSGALREAGQKQSAAVAELKRMLGGLEKAGDFEGVVRKTRDLLDRQEELTRSSAAATQDLAGIDSKSLTSVQNARLSDIAHRQDGLGNELADMVAKAERLGRELGQQDRAAAESLARAREAVEREAVAQHMREATEAIRQNHGNRTAEAQGAAERGLRSMLAALSERSDRKLAALSKELQEVADRLDRLIRAQEDLISRTQSAGQQADAATAVPVLSTRQSTLVRTSGQLAEQIRATQRGHAAKGADAAALVEQASAKMGEASEKLTAADANEAMARQVGVVDLLRQAAKALSAAQEAADREMAARALDALKQTLGEIRSAEMALVDKTEPIRQRHAKDKRLSRPDGIGLNKLASQQGDVRGRLAAAREKMSGAVVYDYVAGQVIESMQAAAGHLRAHRPEEAVRSERAAVESLDRLLEALDLPPPPQSKFADEDSGGGGGGGMREGQKERPVPPLAELKLLRALQAQLNAAVKQFDARVPPPDARTEGELREAESLGKRQQELHELANKLIGK